MNVVARIAEGLVLLEHRLGVVGEALDHGLGVDQRLLGHREDEAERLVLLEAHVPGRVICQFIVNG